MSIHRKNCARRSAPSSTSAIVSTSIEAAEIRVLMSAAPIDGTGNNLQHPDWGSTGEDLLRIAHAAYGDGISSVAGANRPSARLISNTVSDSGGEDLISNRMMSAMIYAWGQFIDHDMTLTASGKTEVMSIPVPKGDPSFDPLGTGTKTIDSMRSAFDPATGKNRANPRQQVNQITAFLDGSMVYGSDMSTMLALRTMSGGKLKSSAGNLLPMNNAATFPGGTLNMDNANPFVTSDKLFAAGDTRANENVELTALQTLFMREHNLQADRIAASNRTLSDEQIFQRARAIVIAEIQAITFNEWLPSLLGGRALSNYTGYKSSVNPGITNEFATAAFRFGHSLLGDDVEFLDNAGLEVRDGVPLSQAFFNPALLKSTGIDSILKYLASDPSSEVDTKVVDSVRNFLFGPPGSGGLDLASLNIQRGRDHGLADYNTTRAALGLPRVTRFDQITSDKTMQAKLQSLYKNVNNIDLWVGGLAEDHVPGSSVGITFQRIIVDQFQRLRDGDRFWYENQFTGRQLDTLRRTSLSDIIERNTSLTSIQHNAFMFKASISGSVVLDQNHNGRPNPGEPPAAHVQVQLVNMDDGSVVATAVTGRRGEYSFDVEDGLRTGVYQVRVTKPNGSLLAASRNIAVTSGDDFERVDLAIPATNPPGHRHAPPFVPPTNSPADLVDPLLTDFSGSTANGSTTVVASRNETITTATKSTAVNTTPATQFTKTATQPTFESGKTQNIRTLPRPVSLAMSTHIESTESHHAIDSLFTSLPEFD